MSRLLFIELWIAAQLFINLVLAMLLWRFIKKMKKTEIELQNVVKTEELKSVTESIHNEVVERIDKLIHDMGEKAAVEMVDRAAQDIIDLIEPLVKSAESKAASFEQQINEKQRIIKNLNDAIDSRIISINLLLSRSEVILNSKDKSIYLNQDNFNRSHSRQEHAGISGGKAQEFESYGLNASSSNLSNKKWIIGEDSSYDKSKEILFDQQQQIIECYQQGLDVDSIASKLSLPRGEVQLVVSLKEKFMKMEK